MAELARILEPVPPSIDALEALVEELPPDQRTAFKWLRPTLRRAFDELWYGPLDDEAVQRAARSVLPALLRVGEALHQAGGRAIARLAEASSAGWRLGTEGMSELLGPATADLADWAVRAFVRIYELALTQANEGLLDTLNNAEFPTEQELGEFMGRNSAAFVRAQTLLMALIEAANREESDLVTRAQELAELAFLEATAAVEMFEAEYGILIDPYAGDDLKTRNARALRSVGQARAVLDEDDIEALEGARLSVLR